VFSDLCRVLKQNLGGHRFKVYRRIEVSVLRYLITHDTDLHHQEIEINMAKASSLVEAILKTNGALVQLNAFFLGTTINSPKYVHFKHIFWRQPYLILSLQTFKCVLWIKHWWIKKFMDIIGQQNEKWHHHSYCNDSSLPVLGKAMEKLKKTKLAVSD
jgi:hypothetical protein